MLRAQRPLATSHIVADLNKSELKGLLNQLSLRFASKRLPRPAPSVIHCILTATLKDENPVFFQIGLFRDTSDTPETILLDRVIEATTKEDVLAAK